MQYLNMFLTFVNSNVKSVKMFGYIKKMYYFCGVKLYKKKERSSQPLSITFI